MHNLQTKTYDTKASVSACSSEKNDVKLQRIPALRRVQALLLQISEQVLGLGAPQRAGRGVRRLRRLGF